MRLVVIDMFMWFTAFNFVEGVCVCVVLIIITITKDHLNERFLNEDTVFYGA